MTTTDQITPQERRRLLSQAVARSVAEGWRVESDNGELAVLVRGRRPNHVLHLILTVLTFGLWLVLWGGLGIFGGEKRRTLSIDAFGNLMVSDL